MKVEKIRVGLKRDVRLARYVVSHCIAELEATLEEEDDIGTAYRELHETAEIMVEEMIDHEKDVYKEAVKNAINSK